MSETWSPASGYYKSHGDGTCHTLWRVCRDTPAGPTTFVELKCSNGRLWLTPRYETAKRKADLLNSVSP